LGELYGENYKVGVQEFRSSGVQEFRSSGVQEFRRKKEEGRKFFYEQLTTNN
jgi:hypothetical protein